MALFKKQSLASVTTTAHGIVVGKIVMCRSLITSARDTCNSMLRSYNDAGSINLSVVARRVKSIKTKLNDVLKLIPKARLHVADYRALAEGINLLRARNVFVCSADLVANCCLFICVFTEADFTENKFRQLLTDFDLNNDVGIVKKDEN